MKRLNLRAHLSRRRLIRTVQSRRIALPRACILIHQTTGRGAKQGRAVYYYYRSNFAIPLRYWGDEQVLHTHHRQKN